MEAGQSKSNARHYLIPGTGANDVVSTGRAARAAEVQSDSDLLSGASLPPVQPAPTQEELLAEWKERPLAQRRGDC